MLIPSIDISKGRAVQWRQGREFLLDGGDPFVHMDRFARLGEVAIVDLDAAVGEGDNREIIERLCRRGRCRVGGGIRDRATAIRWLDAGASKVVIGTAATPELLSTLPRDRVIAAVDAWDGEVVDRATAGLWFLLRGRRRDPSGLVRACHPWETGADDSPRWDDHCPDGFDRDRWRSVKNRLASTIETGPDGEAVANPVFAVAPAGFNALVAFNARELVTVTGDHDLAAAADELVDALAERWDDDLGTWVDAGPTADGSGRVRTLDALLPLLVENDERRTDRVVAQLLDPMAHGGPAGPTGVHRAESVFDPNAYWRGPVWPQLAYLMVRAVAPRSPGAAEVLVRTTVAGAWASGMAEYWNPDTGAGLGAIPQSWTGLALVLARRPREGAVGDQPVDLR